MNDAAIKNFAVAARQGLMRDVATQMRRWAIDEEATVPAAADVLNGRPLTAAERAHRAALLERCARMGHRALCEQAAYTWFNRLAAIRYMEVHDYLPCGMRFFSSAADLASFEPQVLQAALQVDLPGLDRAQVAQLVQAGDHEGLYRRLLLAQCAQLAEALPRVFDRVDACMGLLLPQGLLREGGVPHQLVADVPVGDWQRVEVLGWLYQFYNSELKDDFFKSKRKAAAEDIAPATQLFTPEWIVRYMVENSLGRLWMLNHPCSALRERMDFYIEPDAAHEGFIRVASPEDVTFCDPACGSGHILSYAFELLFLMYQEAGYREREIPSLILQRNLAGMEIDPRAAQIASLVLAMRAREHDRRFLTRGVSADVTVLQSIPLEEGELALSGKALPEALAHLGEVGSLLAPTAEDVANLKRELAACEGDLLGAAKADKVRAAVSACESLSRRFDVVVANPPYMGSSNFNPFMSKWVKKHYPDVKSDLFSAFIVRIMGMAKENGECGIMCPFVWMFIGSYEKLRHKMIEEKTLTSLIQLEYSGFAGATVPICTFTFHNSHIEGYEGGYVRLSDFVGPENQAPKALEAIRNPGCGWLYRRDAQTFTQIPGTPIAYWASDALLEAFQNAKQLSEYGKPRQGLATGKNDLFVREWWEVSKEKSDYACESIEESVASGCKWFPYNKGGDFRKWYGNNESVVNWENDGEQIRNFRDDRGKQLSRPQNTEAYFKPSITWSKISSGSIAFRYKPAGHVFDVAGTSVFAGEDDLRYLQGACNSSTIMLVASMLSPTLNFEVGQIATYPILDAGDRKQPVLDKVEANRDLSKTDWDSFETSWDFKRHSLL